MRLLKQSSTAQSLTFLMVSSIDHVTPVTGLSPTVTISKATAAFASPAGAVSEIGSGWYAVAGNATDTATLGSLILHATATGADPTDREYEIVAFDPQSATNLGLTNLDATVGSRNATTPDNASIATILTYAGVDTAGTTTLLARLTSTRAGLLDNLDAAISTRLAAASYTAPDNADIVTLVARLTSARAALLDNLTRLDVAISTRTVPGDAMVASNMRGTDGASTHSATDVWAVGARSLTTFGTLVADVVTAVWGATVRTLSAFGFTVATTANATETAIKVKTDNLPATPAATGDAMALTTAEREASAAVVEAHLLNEGDSQMLINAIVGAIGNTNIDQTVLVAAIRADLERTGGNLATLLVRIASTLTLTSGKVDVNDKTGFALASAYDPAKTALQSGGSVIASNMRGTDGALLASDYTAPPDASTIAAAVWTATTRSLTTFGTLVSDMATAVWTAATRTLSAFGFSTTADTAAIASAVFEESAPAHNSAGTMGEKLNAAGNAGDPWVTLLPGGYVPGQAGNIVGRFNIPPTAAPLVPIVAPATALQLVGYLYTYDAIGAIVGGVTITFTLTQTPGVVAESDSNVPFTIDSNTTGFLSSPFRKSATYSARRGRNGATVTFTVPTAADSNGGFALPAILGK